MKANELRINNWVKRDSQPDGFQVDASSISRCKYRPDDYQSIPLTEEWLLKFGFEKIDKYTFVKNEFFIHYRKTGFIFNVGKKKIPIKFIHVLQNTYFCIEQKEII